MQGDLHRQAHLFNQRAPEPSPLKPRLGQAACRPCQAAACCNIALTPATARRQLPVAVCQHHGPHRAGCSAEYTTTSGRGTWHARPHSQRSLGQKRRRPARRPKTTSTLLQMSHTVRSIKQRRLVHSVGRDLLTSLCKRKRCCLSVTLRLPKQVRPSSFLTKTLQRQTAALSLTCWQTTLHWQQQSR